MASVDKNGEGVGGEGGDGAGLVSGEAGAKLWSAEAMSMEEMDRLIAEMGLWDVGSIGGAGAGQAGEGVAGQMSEQELAELMQDFWSASEPVDVSGVTEAELDEMLASLAADFVEAKEAVAEARSEPMPDVPFIKIDVDVAKDKNDWTQHFIFSSGEDSGRTSDKAEAACEAASLEVSGRVIESRNGWRMLGANPGLSWLAMVPEGYKIEGNGVEKASWVGAREKFGRLMDRSGVWLLYSDGYADGLAKAISENRPFGKGTPEWGVSAAVLVASGALAPEEFSAADAEYACSAAMQSIVYAMDEDLKESLLAGAAKLSSRLGVKGMRQLARNCFANEVGMPGLCDALRVAPLAERLRAGGNLLAREFDEAAREMSADCEALVAMPRRPMRGELLEGKRSSHKALWELSCGNLEAFSDRMGEINDVGELAEAVRKLPVALSGSDWTEREAGFQQDLARAFARELASASRRLGPKTGKFWESGRISLEDLAVLDAPLAKALETLGNGFPHEYAMQGDAASPKGQALSPLLGFLEQCVAWAPDVLAGEATVRELERLAAMACSGDSVWRSVARSGLAAALFAALPDGSAQECLRGDWRAAGAVSRSARELEAQGCTELAALARKRLSRAWSKADVGVMGLGGLKSGLGMEGGIEPGQWALAEDALEAYGRGEPMPGLDLGTAKAVLLSLSANMQPKREDRECGVFEETPVEMIRDVLGAARRCDSDMVRLVMRMAPDEKGLFLGLADALETNARVRVLGDLVGSGAMSMEQARKEVEGLRVSGRSVCVEEGVGGYVHAERPAVSGKWFSPDSLADLAWMGALAGKAGAGLLEECARCGVDMGVRQERLVKGAMISLEDVRLGMEKVPDSEHLARIESRVSAASRGGERKETVEGKVSYGVGAALAHLELWGLGSAECSRGLRAALEDMESRFGELREKAKAGEVPDFAALLGKEAEANARWGLGAESERYGACLAGLREFFGEGFWRTPEKKLWREGKGGLGTGSKLAVLAAQGAAAAYDHAAGRAVLASMESSGLARRMSGEELGLGSRGVGPRGEWKMGDGVYESGRIGRALALASEDGEGRPVYCLAVRGTQFPSLEEAKRNGLGAFGKCCAIAADYLAIWRHARHFLPLALAMQRKALEDGATFVVAGHSLGAAAVESLMRFLPGADAGFMCGSPGTGVLAATGREVWKPLAFWFGGRVGGVNPKLFSLEDPDDFVTKVGKGLYERGTDNLLNTARREGMGSSFGAMVEAAAGRIGRSVGVRGWLRELMPSFRSSFMSESDSHSSGKYAVQTSAAMGAGAVIESVGSRAVRLR